jgi:predicted phage tail protein
MKVKLFKNLNDCDEFETSLTDIRDILSFIKLRTSKEFLENFLARKYKYVLYSEVEGIEPVALEPEIITSTLSIYDTLLIIPEFEGEIPAVAVAGIIGVGTVTASGVLVATTAQLILIYAITAIVNIAISLAISMITQALSPTQEFASDPAMAQTKQSSLFNGAPIIREQGGIVPLCYGEGFAGGVLISSSLTSTQG